ncbi:translation initiation factor IF-2, chloroplastic [Dioscorea cayenensis subsp. rotundata]|uniref:Translation initiation factor IF-2, chloroplastic n=1 Tax=Dioscorea cayennensis subsp. rotundata TaxID=55577 RepID=A0AB40D5P5_DIOCR|nr:translation initiation factor IF-2, chloroplastic [Dioscorea cayenensis subsp. rotundata]
MASPASLATLGSTRPSGLDVSSPWAVSIRRIHVVSRISFNYYGETRRWCRSPARLCKCMVTTGFIEEKKASVSPESTFKSSSVGGGDGDADLVLKPAPKPVLKAPDDSINSTLWSPAKVAGKVRPELPVEGRENVLESLGEVLEKAEKLETSNSTKFVVDKDRRDNGKMSDNPKPPKPVSASSSLKKAKTLKSVWRKGNPVANMKRVVSEVPRAEKGKEEEKAPSLVVERKDSVNLPVTPSRPQMSLPPKPTPKLQARPPAAPLPPKPPVLNKPNSVRERKPILIDKFAPKKSAIDPIAAEAILAAPTKPGKGPPPTKVKDERRKRSSAAGSLRRRLADDAKIPEEDASELGVPIPGVKDTRKGRKWTKASRKAARLQAARAAEPVRVEILEVGEEGMLAEDLAFNLAVSEADILSYLYAKGVKPDMVQTLDKDMVKMICKEYDVEVLEVEPVRVEDMAKKNEMLDEEDLDMLEDRPPVITIMGHVDHGKTTLLDYIRKSKVVASEAGGITQGIGAYKVQIPVDGKLQPCVFLDTPGHEAFGAMRARGAKVTDIVIIVVAADDGVRPQTSEAIAHAKAAGVPIIVAINKVDKDGASPDRVMQELSSVGLMPEAWGGDTPMVQISALKGENIDELLETIVLVAELQELKANPHRSAKGTVVEAGLDKAKGPVATLIVQNGTLKKSDVVVCGEAYGKVRALFDDRGNRVDEAGPSTAVQVIGLSDVPIAGDRFEVVESLDVAREKAEACGVSLRAARISAKAGEGKVTLSSIASAVSAGKQGGLDMHQLNIILKVDVQGSIEAIRQAIQVLPQDNVTLKFLLQAPGDISASDADLAVATEAVIFGFNVKAPGSVKSYADKKNVEIRLYRVIYDLIDDMRKAMEGLLYPVEEQVSIGTANVRATFSSGSGRVAGCMVAEGKVVKDCGVSVLRKGKIIHTGKISSLRRVKEEVKEVAAGLECGIGMDDYNDWEAGDVIEAFNTIKKQRTLEEASASVTAALAGAGIQL